MISKLLLFAKSCKSGLTETGLEPQEGFIVMVIIVPAEFTTVDVTPREMPLGVWVKLKAVPRPVPVNCNLYSTSRFRVERSPPVTFVIVGKFVPTQVIELITPLGATRHFNTSKPLVSIKYRTRISKLPMLVNREDGTVNFN